MVMETQPPGNMPPGKRESLLLKPEPGLKPRFPLLERLPCANAIDLDRLCGKLGTKACGACRLVSYCSQACQKEHWKLHKYNCKDYLRSKNFVPEWVQEGREPRFDPSKDGDEEGRLALWGTMPCIDVINLAKNEQDSKRDFSIAFPASGDLRDVVKTINSLPSDYSGRLTVVLNDVNPGIACRNLVLFLLLGTIEDEVIAAEVALHFWYSVFMPPEYHCHIQRVVTSYLSSADDPALANEPFSLGTTSRLFTSLPLDPEARGLLSQFTNPNPPFAPETAQETYDAAMLNPSRVDDREKMYAKLDPSHRAAVQEFRRFGVLLPFGAITAHCTRLNEGLFVRGEDELGEWVDWTQGDLASPLRGWDIVDVVAEGKKRGTTAEDLFGCLYFYLTTQFREFSRRLTRWDVSIHLFSVGATTLAKNLRDHRGANGPSNPDKSRLLECPPFDRIILSDLADTTSLGLSASLDAWSPLLSKTNKKAVIVGYLKDWVYAQRDARVKDVSGVVLDRAMDKYLLFTKPREKKYAGVGLKEMADNLQADMWSMLGDLDAFHDHSRSWSMFLKKQGVEKMMKRTGLILREEHTIVPHRFCVPLKASSDAVPQLKDEEVWYHYAKVAGYTWTERFIECSWDEHAP